MSGVFFKGGDYTSPRPLQQAGSIIRGAAAVDCSFGRVVVWGENGFEIATSANGNTSGICLTRDGKAKKNIDVLTAGAVEAKDWTSVVGTTHLEASMPYFLQPDGTYSTIPDSEGFIVRVGRAVSPTVLLATFDLKVS